jgi:hypothetical protein
LLCFIFDLHFFHDLAQYANETKNNLSYMPDWFFLLQSTDKAANAPVMAPNHRKKRW